MPKPQKYPVKDLKGQVVLITGASAGIGESCAWRFAELGCHLILLARRRERLEALQAELQAEYPDIRCHLICCDIRNWGELERSIKTLPEEFSNIDILLNNSGLALGVAPGHETDAEDIKVMIETNVSSLFYITGLIVPKMVERGRGHVINMSSVAAKESYAGGAVYCSTKHAISAYTDALRHDLLNTPIRVSTVSPGLVKTEFSLVRFKGDAEKAEQPYAGTEPLQADDIADNVVYVATRPDHVQVADILVLCTYQSSAKSIYRPFLQQK